jgi:uncharacterized membrane-anchored protein
VETQVDITEVETQTAAVVHTDETPVATNVKKSPSTHNVMIVGMTVRFHSNRTVVNLYVVAIVSAAVMTVVAEMIVHHTDVTTDTMTVAHSTVLDTTIVQNNQSQNKILAQRSRKKLSRSTISWNAFSNYSNVNQ